jgi:hypothetical protein
MRAAIFGDSFTQYFTNSWCDRLFDKMDWQLVDHFGFPGQSEHRIYDAFIRFVETNDVDIIVFCHTHFNRLPNKHNLGINIGSLQKPGKIPPSIQDAARGYYEHIYLERFHEDAHYLMIRDIQSICFKKKIKQIHLESFKCRAIQEHGMWLNTPLFEIGSTQPEGWVWDDKLRNHLSPDLNAKLADWLVPRIKWYLDKDIDHHSVTLYPEELA